MYLPGGLIQQMLWHFSIPELQLSHFVDQDGCAVNTTFQIGSTATLGCSQTSNGTEPLKRPNQEKLQITVQLETQSHHHSHLMVETLPSTWEVQNCIRRKEELC